MDAILSRGGLGVTTGFAAGGGGGGRVGVGVGTDVSVYPWMGGAIGILPLAPPLLLLLLGVDDADVCICAAKFFSSCARSDAGT